MALAVYARGNAREAALCVSGQSATKASLKAIAVSGHREYESAMTSLLQRRAGQLQGSVVYLTQEPSKMDLGMAWREGLYGVVYLKGENLKAVKVDNASASANFPELDVSQVDNWKCPHMWHGKNEFFSLPPALQSYLSHDVSQWYSNTCKDSRDHTEWWRKMLFEYQSCPVQQGRPSTLNLAVRADVLAGQRAHPGLPGRTADTIYMALAYALVGRVWCDRNLVFEPRTEAGIGRGHNVGALLVSPKNRILAWGVNLSTTLNNATYHAETVMIQNYLERTGNKALPEDSKIYTTLQPCYMCAGFIATVGKTVKVVYGQVDAVGGGPLQAVQSTSQYLRNVNYDTGTELKTRLDADLKAGRVKGVIDFLYTAKAREVLNQAEKRPATLQKILTHLSESPPSYADLPKHLQHLDLARKPKQQGPRIRPEISPTEPMLAALKDGMDLLEGIRKVGTIP
ncbi:nucleoside deaminase [Longimicrobium sp.]|uniref:nucleoside deaminase n=1 Tax=Longimicrobium sp. TaxID=2029185 RepID=UPI002EDB087D